MVTQSTVSNMPFLGSEVSTTYDTAQVVILPIPYEATTTYRQGCQDGPSAILSASCQVEYYDDELEHEVWPIGIHTHASVASTHNEQSIQPEMMLQTVQEAVFKLIQDRKFVIALGGEHTITAGVVAAYCQANANEPFTVVQIDAHGDLRQEYEGSIHNHACVMRRVIDMDLPTVQIGIRSICSEEAALIKQRQLTVIRAQEMAQSNWMEQALTSIPTRRVFLTIDLDGIDPTLIPGVGTPEPGGLSWFMLLTFLRQLFESYQVIGCDVMELAPIPHSVVSEFTAAKLVYKLIGYHAVAQGL